jgi:hypothetical protein
MPTVYIRRRFFYVATGILVNHFSLVGHHVMPTARLLYDFFDPIRDSFAIPRLPSSPLIPLYGYEINPRGGSVDALTSTVERNSSTALVND